MKIHDALRPETVLSMAQLAQAIDAACGGLRHPGRGPTSDRTCQRWCLYGRSGVKLFSWLEVNRRLTTWGSYRRFCAELERAHEEMRQRRRAAVAELGVRARKQAARRGERARARLEEMGAR